MDFESLNQMLCSENTNNKQKQYPSASDSATSHNQHQMRDIKLLKISQEQRSDRTSVCSDSHNMLSFCSPNTQQNHIFCYYDRNTTGVRGPFTSSQWMELEHQALIYKYMTVNVPVPSSLLVPIRKALESAAFCSFPASNPLHSTYGWGGLHLGFSNNSDPEPGRCRRTDGKKWRCARDAVTDQKYCERHMNRGRHRSRKPVETTAVAAAKVSSSAAAVTAVSTVINQQNQQQIKRGNMEFEKIQDSTFNSMLSPSAFKIQLHNERSQPVNWIPVSWEASIGGPLGEVLNHGTNTRE